MAAEDGDRSSRIFCTLEAVMTDKRNAMRREINDRRCMGFNSGFDGRERRCIFRRSRMERRLC